MEETITSDLERIVLSSPTQLKEEEKSLTTRTITCDSQRSLMIILYYLWNASDHPKVSVYTLMFTHYSDIFDEDKKEKYLKGDNVDWMDLYSIMKLVQTELNDTRLDHIVDFVLIEITLRVTATSRHRISLFVVPMIDNHDKTIFVVHVLDSNGICFRKSTDESLNARLAFYRILHQMMNVFGYLYRNISGCQLNIGIEISGGITRGACQFVNLYFILRSVIQLQGRHKMQITKKIMDDIYGRYIPPAALKVAIILLYDRIFNRSDAPTFDPTFDYGKNRCLFAPWMRKIAAYSSIIHQDISKTTHKIFRAPYRSLYYSGKEGREQYLNDNKILIKRTEEEAEQERLGKEYLQLYLSEKEEEIEEEIEEEKEEAEEEEAEERKIDVIVIPDPEEEEEPREKEVIVISDSEEEEKEVILIPDPEEDINVGEKRKHPDVTLI